VCNRCERGCDRCDKDKKCGKCEKVCGLTVNKNLLSIDVAASSPTSYIFTVIYEIVFQNEGTSCFNGLQINDSLFGLIDDSCGTFSLNAVTVSVPCGSTLTPQSDNCKVMRGILLDDCNSTIAPCTVNTLRIKVIGTKTCGETVVLNLQLRNTLIVTGKTAGRCQTNTPFFPIYVAGELVTAAVTLPYIS